MTLKKEIEFRPAFDKRHSDPSKNFGIGAMLIKFYLHGPLGSIQFVLSTGMYLKRTLEEYEHLHPTFKPEWMGYDLGYHSPKPMYEGQLSMSDCPFIEGGTCYYDGSSLRANKLAERFIEEGEDYLWRTLEDEYRARFEEEGA